MAFWIWIIIAMGALIISDYVLDTPGRCKKCGSTLAPVGYAMERYRCPNCKIKI
jgi:predicted Zn-ribbon and HTH transcriptional regulator